MIQAARLLVPCLWLAACHSTPPIPQYLFLNGGSNYQFSIPNKGLLYPISMPFFLLGLWVLMKMVIKKEKIGIFGDHDVDGISSAVLMAEILEKLNLEVEVYIPDKKTEGHGINKKAIDLFSSLGITLMISVDCGVSNFAEVEYAKSKNIETIITDHHLAPDEIPQAFAIINPKMSNSGYPFSGLCGVGVVFKVVQPLD